MWQLRCWYYSVVFGHLSNQPIRIQFICEMSNNMDSLTETIFPPVTFITLSPLICIEMYWAGDITKTANCVKHLPRVCTFLFFSFDCQNNNRFHFRNKQKKTHQTLLKHRHFVVNFTFFFIIMWIVNEQIRGTEKEKN